jgi:hypothetical protein
VRHRAQIVDLVGLDLADDVEEVAAVRQVPVVEEESHVVGVHVLVDVLDAARVERRRPPDDAVDDVAFLEQELGQIGAVLARDARHERDLRLRALLRLLCDVGGHGSQCWQPSRWWLRKKILWLPTHRQLANGSSIAVCHAAPIAGRLDAAQR